MHKRNKLLVKTMMHLNIRCSDLCVWVQRIITVIFALYAYTVHIFCLFTLLFLWICFSFVLFWLKQYLNTLTFLLWLIFTLFSPFPWYYYILRWLLNAISLHYRITFNLHTLHIKMPKTTKKQQKTQTIMSFSTYQTQTAILTKRKKKKKKKSRKELEFYAFQSKECLNQKVDFFALASDLHK